MPEFRALCHIIRRGSCTDRLKKWAKHNQMSPNTLAKALHVLQARRIISKTKRYGQTSSYAVNPIGSWFPPEPKGIAGNLNQNSRQGVKPKEVLPPEPIRSNKVTPIEVTPYKGGESNSTSHNSGPTKQPTAPQSTPQKIGKLFPGEALRLRDLHKEKIKAIREGIGGYRKAHDHEKADLEFHKQQIAELEKQIGVMPPSNK